MPQSSTLNPSDESVFYDYHDFYEFSGSPSACARFPARVQPPPPPPVDPHF